MNKTKIVCTLGPASQDKETIRQLLENGMNVARLNFSHGSHESHGETIRTFRSVRDQLGIPGAVMLDTKGPEIRIGDFAGGSAELKSGNTFTLTTEKCTGDSSMVSVSLDILPQHVKKDDTVLIDDGMLRLTVIETSRTEVKCRVENGGTLTDHKGVNIPGVHMDMPYLSQQDKSDLLFGIEKNVDYVAASFVRSGEDVETLRSFLNENGGFDIMIISKIECLEGIEDFDRILKLSDGIMVARGDMGVEVDFEKLPGLQKKFIRKCCQAGKPVITATQMLESMTENPSPTRAEITDVANAIFDGTSAVMLSGESASGRYPVESVKTMTRIIRQAEADLYEINGGGHVVYDQDKVDISNAIGHAACTTAEDINASAIVAVTTSGYTANKMSKYRPAAPIVAVTPGRRTYHRLSLIRGVYPIMTELCDDWAELMNTAIELTSQHGFASAGDSLVISAGMPIMTSGTTNLIRVVRL